MKTDRRIPIQPEGKSLSWGAIAVAAFMLLASLGGLIYFFTISVP